MSKPQSGIDLGNREFFIRRWNQEHPAFIDVCRALPPDRLDYRPHPGSRSAGELVALLISLQKGCVELCETGRSSYSSGLRWHPTVNTSVLDEMIASFENHHRALADKLRSLDDAAWSRPGWLVQADQEIILKDTIGGVLWIALFDAVHHRGQLSTYIRPMGGKVPSIYGPSADAPARGPKPE